MKPVARHWSPPAPSEPYASQALLLGPSFAIAAYLSNVIAWFWVLPRFYHRMSLTGEFPLGLGARLDGGVGFLAGHWSWFLPMVGALAAGHLWGFFQSGPFARKAAWAGTLALALLFLAACLAFCMSLSPNNMVGSLSNSGLH